MTFLVVFIGILELPFTYDGGTLEDKVLFISPCGAAWFEKAMLLGHNPHLGRLSECYAPLPAPLKHGHCSIIAAMDRGVGDS